MSVIITGASGFIGSPLLQAARAAWGIVTAFSSRPAEGSTIVYRDAPEFGLSCSDIKLVKEAEVLIHAGAFIPKIGSEANQIIGCSGNIKFTEKLLSLPWNNLKKIVYISTVDVYAEACGPISEATPTMPTSLYGLSKLYCERLMSLYAFERDLALQILRVGHVYGPGEEKYSKVLPIAIQNILAGRDIELWGDGSELRSFIYIDDVVTSILRAVELVERPGIINVVGGKTISIRDLLEKLIAIGGRNTGIIQREFSGTTRNFVFDNNKMKHYLLPDENEFMLGLLSEFKHFEKIRADLR